MTPPSPSTVVSEPSAPTPSQHSTQRNCTVVVVGAGFAGMYMLHKLRGLGFDVRGIERAHGVGGTWYWNRYPGARCDVESMQYSYSFDPALQQDWEWTERYSGQPEILRYANHVADRYDLRPLIDFGTSVTAVRWDDETRRWHLSTAAAEPAATANGAAAARHADQHHRAAAEGVSHIAQFVVMATGCLSSANTPDFAGIEDFRGPTYHTGRWPHEKVDFSGLDVGIIGTGSTAVQAIPLIAAECETLTVFQRTPNYSIPARNQPLDAREQAEWKASYDERRAAAVREASAILPRLPRQQGSAKEATEEDFQQRLQERWELGGFTFYGAYEDIPIDKQSNERVAAFVREKIAQKVADPSVAALLTPHNTIACKRPCLDTQYFETFNRPNVKLVDVSQHPIERITASGVVANSTEYPVDALVFATGFDAMTGTLMRMHISGRDGCHLNDRWDAGPRNYLGLSVTGFPNLFTVSGPGSPSVLTNMIPSIEQHVEWIADCLSWMRAGEHETIEATAEAEEAWVQHVNGIADLTLYPTCNSWYLGANIPGKTRVFMPLIGFPPYVEICDDVAADDYRGFAVA